MEALSKYLAKLGGQLEPGWRCQVRKRAGPGNRVDTYFNSPHGEKFRSALSCLLRHASPLPPVARCCSAESAASWKSCALTLLQAKKIEGHAWFSCFPIGNEYVAQTTTGADGTRLQQSNLRVML